MSDLPPPPPEPSAMPSPTTGGLAPSAEPYQLTHRGHVYGLGFGPTFFGIWRLEGGSPVETFERTQQGWERAWARFRRLDARDHVPRWRRPSAGWILLNLVIAISLWLGALVIDALVLLAAGRDTEELTDTASGGAAIALPLTVAAWMLFVYLGSRRARWIALLVLGGAALAVTIGTGLAAQPAG